MPKFKEHLSFL